MTPVYACENKFCRKTWDTDHPYCPHCGSPFIKQVAASVVE